MRRVWDVLFLLHCAIRIELKGGYHTGELETLGEAAQ